MAEKVCTYCGSVLTVAAVVKTTETGYEYVCEGCAVADVDA